MIADALQRRQARDPAYSVIVQAPAGSGKTELLMQRYLALLAQVDEPEQILAVTFTRKAAAEMRQRVLHALQAPDWQALLPETATLAQAVIAHSEQRGWQLLNYPARLRIRTFDAVSNWLKDSAPVSDRSGVAQGQVSGQTDACYRLAAQRTLELIADEDHCGVHLRGLLTHLDNNADHVVEMVARMLACRDQWLPLIGSGQVTAATRDLLERSIAELISRELKAAAALLDPAWQNELLSLLPYAASRLGETSPDALICCWQDCRAFPQPVPAELSYWQAIAEFFLVKSTSDGPAFRAKINKNLGFPTPADGGDAELKNRAVALLAACSNSSELAAALDRIRGLPQPQYSAAQWQALAAMIAVLPVAVAQLQFVFSETGETDYVEIANQALLALGEDDSPTRLALCLDYQIQHILIDEFQDTSRAQFRLLQRLTVGWNGNDGRTLMVVGDPMQSIYRFRQAEVGLFTQLWEQGLGELELRPLTLVTNFRSDPSIVNWVNNAFERLLPAENDAAVGAVRFAPGTADKGSVAGCKVELHCLEQPARLDEARQVATLVQDCLAASATDTVGILVRTRYQARLIGPALRERGIPFFGEGLEIPGETRVEQDLLALTRALSHQADRTAWLALLRAPWCGLTLVDIELLCGDNWRQTVTEQLENDDCVLRLSTDGQRRALSFRSTMADILSREGRYSFRDWVEGAWQQLGGPASLSKARDLELAQQLFRTLDDFDSGGSTSAAWRLQMQLGDRPDPGFAATEIRVHLLTLFKAKGLEYDLVILPGLDGKTRGHDKQALIWHEFQGSDGTEHILMAPVQAAGEQGDSLQSLIRRFEQEQLDNERNRLLYVATTRAKKQLHLFAEIRRKSSGEAAMPPSGSLLQSLWPVVASECSSFNGPVGTPEKRDLWLQPMIQRFSEDFAVPAAPAGIRPVSAAPVSDEEAAVSYDWAGAVARHIGNVVHRCLQHLAEHDLPLWDDASLLASMLREEGVPGVAIDDAVMRTSLALRNVFADETGCWIMQGHAEAASELPLTAWHGGGTVRLVIDRTFVTPDGTRWIIDFKTGSHEGGDLDAFLERELSRYAPQLQRYRMVMQGLEPDRRIRTALYFPMLREFRELESLQAT